MISGLPKKSWPYWQPLSILARLTEEVGEVARVINHLYGEKPKKASEAEQELQNEIGDVLYTIACLCNREGIDMDAALLASLEKVQMRDHDRF